jgi:DNA-binding transcriptional LysR family regulator
MITLKQLTAFIAAAKHRSISRAGEELRISQPAVSKHMRLLEKNCHVRLYYKKNSGGIELTDEGRDVLIHAREIVDGIERLKREFGRRR